MKKLLITVILFISIVAGFVACSATNSGTILGDTKWFLRSYGEQSHLISIIEGTEITATFNSAEGRISGSSGCNTYFAEYEAEDSRLSIFEMAYTEMACLSPEGVMEQEQEYLYILANARSFQANDTTLTIFCSGGLQLYFTTAAGTQ